MNKYKIRLYSHGMEHILLEREIVLEHGPCGIFLWEKDYYNYWGFVNNTKVTIYCYQMNAPYRLE